MKRLNHLATARGAATPDFVRRQPRRLAGIGAIGILAAAALVPVAHAAGTIPPHAHPAASAQGMMGTDSMGQMMASRRMTRSWHMMNGSASGSGIGMAGGMMGGMMSHGETMGGTQGAMMGQDVSTTTPAAARALSRQAAATASVDPRTNTVVYHGSDVTLVALASPEGGPDMTWNIDGRVNPTVVIPRGAQVTVDFFDGDAGTMHGWELTTAHPPYPTMAMMAGSIAFPGAFAMPVPGANSTHWFGRAVHFTASQTGTYFYLCPVPGHAARGMYGTLLVR